MEQESASDGRLVWRAFGVGGRETGRALEMGLQGGWRLLRRNALRRRDFTVSLGVLNREWAQ